MKKVLNVLSTLIIMCINLYIMNYLLTAINAKELVWFLWYVSIPLTLCLRIIADLKK